MEIYDEYCVRTTATQKEKVTAIALIALAFLGVAGAFLWWPLLIAGIVFGAAAVWYWPRLHYEYEYELYSTEMDIAKIINKADRKTLATIDLQQMEFFTNDAGQIRAGNQARVYDYAGDPGQGENCWIVVRSDAGLEIFKITADVQMFKDLRRAWPQKARLIQSASHA